MGELHLTAQIDAPAHIVWTTMLGDETYRRWTSPFNEAGSYYEGSWDQGNEIRFLGPDMDGSLGGMIARVTENQTDAALTLEFVGEIVNGVDHTGDEARSSGGLERYVLSESGGVTTLVVDVESAEDFTARFREMWTLSLTRLKEIAESRAASQSP